MSPSGRQSKQATKPRHFEDEMLRHMDAVYDSALRLAGNAADADDLVQATMLKAYRFLDHYQQGTNAKAWLLTILRNTFINQQRRRRREPTALELDGDRTGPDQSTVPLAASDQSLGHQAIMDDVSEEISRALAALSDEYRQALLLSDIDGYSYQEIADIMGCPIGTVRSRISRARKHLRQQLLAFANAQGIVPQSR